MARKEMTIIFDKGLNQGLSTFSGDRQSVNCFPVLTPGERSPAQLVSIPGGDVINSCSPSEGTGCRGLWVASTGPATEGNISTLYGVYGNTLFRIKRNGAFVKVGSLMSSSKLVSFAENQDQTKTQTQGFVCDGVTVYTWDLKAEDADLPSSYQEATLPYVNGSSTERAMASYISYNAYRLILTCSNSIQWYFSDLNSSNFDSASFESSESNPDQTVRAINHGGNVWVFSRYSYDIFTPTFNADDPFDVGSGASGKIGCSNGDTISTVGDYIFWMGQGETSDNSIYMATVSGGIKEISDPGIKNILQKWQYQAYSKGMAFSDRGHTFYAITSTMDDQTLVYDVNTEQWHIRSSSNDGKLHYWDQVAVKNCYGKTWYANVDSNAICQNNYDTIQDQSGRPITRYWQSPVYLDGGDYIKLSEVRVDVECGAYANADSTHSLYIQPIWDGRQLDRFIRPLGRAGQRSRQVSLCGGGCGRNLVLRVGTSSRAPVILYSIRMVLETSGRTA